MRRVTSDQIARSADRSSQKTSVPPCRTRKAYFEFSVPISVENAEFPTQICFAETTEGIACTAFFIWKNDH